MKARQNVTFKIKGKWTVDEMVNFLKSITSLYDAFFAIEIKRLEIEKKAEFLYEKVDDFYHYWEKYMDNPIFKEFWYLWKKIIRDYIRRGKPYPPFLLPGFYPFLPPEITEFFKISTIEIYQNIDTYRHSDQKLNIKSIKMESPGFISFEGIDRIIEQIREFVKDIMYRNKQEKEKGKIELKIKKIEYAEKIKQLLVKNIKGSNEKLATIIEPENEFIRIVISNINVIEELEKQGKIEKCS